MMQHILTYKGYDIYKVGNRFEMLIREVSAFHHKYASFPTIESAKRYIERTERNENRKEEY